MIQAFVITLREGIEAFLIVAISLAYLRKSGRAELIRAVHWGIVAALAVSAAGGYLLYRRLESGMARRAAGPHRRGLGGRPDRAHVARGPAYERRHRGPPAHLERRAGAAAFLGVFLFTALMISREGMETVAAPAAAPAGAPARRSAPSWASSGASFVAWLWSRYGHRVPLTLFLQTTAIFLFIFVVQLFIYGIHEMSEQNFLPYSADRPRGHRSVGAREHVRPRPDVPAGAGAARPGWPSRKSRFRQSIVSDRLVRRVQSRSLVESSRVDRVSRRVSPRLHRLGARRRRAPDDRVAHGRRLDARGRPAVSGVQLDAWCWADSRRRCFCGWPASAVALSAARLARSRRAAETRLSARSASAASKSSSSPFCSVCRRSSSVPAAMLVTIFRVDILNVMGPAIVAAGLVWALGASADRHGSCGTALSQPRSRWLTPVVRTAAIVDELPRVAPVVH